MPDLFESRLAALRSGRTPFVLATVVAAVRPQSARPGAKAIILEDGSVEGWFGGGCVLPVVVREALEVLERGEPCLVRFDGDGAPSPPAQPGVKVHPIACQGEGGLTVFLEPMARRPALVVLGATPVAAAVTRLAAELGYEVREPATSTTAPSPVDTSEVVRSLDDADAIVVATMGTGDEEALRAALESDAGYIALVASRKKGDFLCSYLRGLGVAAERFARLKYPAGLDLGGASAPEIALSVLAEVVQRRYRQHVPAASVGMRAGGADETRDAVPGSARRTGRALAVAPAATDPVCGMQVDPASERFVVDHEGHRYHFCCQRCQDAFRHAPTRYLEAST